MRHAGFEPGTSFLRSIVKLTIVGCCDEEVSEEYEDEGVGEDVDEELEPQQVVQLLQHM